MNIVSSVGLSGRSVRSNLLLYRLFTIWCSLREVHRLIFPLTATFSYILYNIHMDEQNYILSYFSV